VPDRRDPEERPVDLDREPRGDAAAQRAESGDTQWQDSQSGTAHIATPVARQATTAITSASAVQVWRNWAMARHANAASPMNRGCVGTEEIPRRGRSTVTSVIAELSHAPSDTADCTAANSHASRAAVS
jgi:hypothetical protein